MVTRGQFNKKLSANSPNYPYKKAILPDNLSILLIHFSERRCREWVIHELHPDGIYCPSCGVAQDSSRIQLAYSLKRIRCCSCGRKFSAYTGTSLENTQLGPRQIVVMLMLFRMGRPDKDIAHAAQMSRSTAARWRRFFRAAGSRFV